MQRNRALIAAVVATSTIAFVAPALAGITVQTTNFLNGYTHYNGFEGMGETFGYPANTPYTEDGISVTYVGYAGIWTTSQAAEGLYGWYPNGSGYGYTDITFGQTINAVEFQAGSGWFNPPAELTYNVLLGGVSIATGTISGLPTYGSFHFYGFSGGNFDEIQLQGRHNSGNVFDPYAQEAGVFDAINFGGVLNAPEPSSWLMMVGGFGLAGAALRRVRRRAISFA